MEKEWKIAGFSLLAGMVVGFGIAYLVDGFSRSGDGDSKTSEEPLRSAAREQRAPVRDGGGGIEI